MTVTKPMTRGEVDELIEAEFGVNATYVSDLYHQFERDPESVDEEWREYFDSLRSEGAPAGNGRTNGSAAAPPAPAPVPASIPVPAVAPVTSPETAERPAQPITETAPPAGEAAPSGEPARQIAEAPVQVAAARPAPARPEVQPAATEAERVALRGPALRIAQNMEASLAVPTATSERQIPIKLLEENRRLINQFLAPSGRKVSYTHIVGRAILKALDRFPQLNDSYEISAADAYRIHNTSINLGVAVDVTRKDGSRSLLVPNIKSAEKLTFPQLLAAYDDVVKRAREGKLTVPDFEGTTISLTNPGTIGTTASSPRLMSRQGAIIATGAIDYPPEYHAMMPEAVSRLGISKVMSISSTYDHRIIQGAESGSFLALIENLLKGKDGFYEEIFADLGIPFRPYKWAVDRNPAILGEQRYSEEVRKQSRVLELINAYRVRGHLIADINPLGWKEVQYHPELDIDTYGLTIWDLDREFITGGLGNTETATLRQIVDWLRTFYCGKFGIEYRNIQGPEEKEWLRAHVERTQPEVPVESRKQILWKLISAESFEKFLGTKYLGQKRFSIEGAETIVALLDQLIEQAAVRGIDDITIGMSHRGRLNVIANVIGKFCERIFTSFEGSIHPNFLHDQGDVKYHQGASGVRETASGPVTLTVPPNPSHLEFVDPVVEGMVRAKQDKETDATGAVTARPDRNTKLAVLLHGDAAFAGEGIVAETLNMSGLQGYRTGGTIHVIVNNQLGFTTSPESGRSSVYSTDVAKMIQIPIFHVNGDDPDTAFNVLRIALDYRQSFHKDVVIDLMGFRRHGHNEGDEPSYTQPVMYKQVRAHPGVRDIYARRLISEGAMDAEAAAALIEERHRRYENALLGAKEIVAKQGLAPQLHVPITEPEASDDFETGVDHARLIQVAHAITTVPRGFNLNPKITSLLARRAKMVEGAVPVDFGMAEALAFGTLVLEAIPVRLSGEDSVRGTFSHRHATFYDTQTDAPWTPLSVLSSDQARFQVYDSPLSEAGVLGFDYGYSVAYPNCLVLWEAQFGDFINAAQVIVDQFVIAGEEKWDQKTRLVMLLPHGFEGQGPEHSSARLERFLNLCAEGNIRVANCSTASQYFHLLRKQARRELMKPLVIMTPKSMLRAPEASSPIQEFITGGFKPVLKDESIASPLGVKRVLLCSGKIYFDLVAERKKRSDETTAIVRVEQFYPFPLTLLRKMLGAYPNASDVRWVQEEPENMGAWEFMERRLRGVIGAGRTLTYAGRAESASPATGSHTVHQMEQQKLLDDAFADRL